MKFVFKFPDIGGAVIEGTILELKVKVGQQIKHNDVVMKVETDKAVIDIACLQEGVVKKLFVKVGQVVEIGEDIMLLEGNYSQNDFDRRYYALYF